MTRSLIPLQRMGVRQLRLLVAIAETGSMLAAAGAMGLTQPAVTKTVRELEADLGVPLFERGSRGVTPTVYGDTLVRHARLILAQLAHAAEALDDLAHGAGGRVVVGTLLAASAWLLPRAIVGLRADRPKVVVEVVEGTNERLQPMLLRGELDMVVGRLSEFRFRAGVRQERLYDEQIVVLARPGHPMAARRRVALGDLQPLDWILPPPETTLRRQLEKAFFDAGLEPPRAAVESVSLPTNRRLLRESDLIGAWPDGIAADELETGRLAALPIRLSQILGPVGVSTRGEGALSPAAEAFLAALRRAAGAAGGGADLSDIA